MKVFAVHLDSYVQLANGNSVVNGYTESTKWVGSGLMGDPYKDNTVKCSIPTRSAPKLASPLSRSELRQEYKSI